ncbi:TIGR02710 family CRISPR-associated CARF protein [Paucidesulfovibrio longus]|uniref:TIGR02710 family CRISPR-associated CARF protein n=1 Tax=Paucidesulfovibrio longus TaxID=889 RepID=UPI0003B4EF54|nr:TIGR02710 family CRISPR-associated CARF protein [Paucidesulfovibrio longus]
MANGGKTLFLTVGTGTAEILRESMLVPLRKSILHGTWEEVVLLPSQKTTDSAKLLCEELQGIRLVVSPLPRPGQEDNADQTYAHFESVIAERIASGVPPGQMVADFTRGTKAMSAALVLAAARHGIPRLRYIIGERNSSGSVKAGMEVVQEFSTTTASGHRLLDQALLVMTKGNFAAVQDILPAVEDPLEVVWPEAVRELFSFARAAAAFYSAWDRLDYAEALRLLKSGIPECPDRAWARFTPGKDVAKHVKELAAARPNTNKECAAWVRIKAVDLLANGERRIRDRQFEDAYLRAYRVLELIGQVGLFVHGLDSSDIPKDNPAVQALQEKLKKKHENGFGMNRRTGNYTAPRELAARLLKFMDDPMGAKLLEVGKGGFTQARNNSLLIHGFTATQQATDESLRSIYADLERLLREEFPCEAESTLEVARSADFCLTSCQE